MPFLQEEREKPAGPAVVGIGGETSSRQMK